MRSSPVSIWKTERGGREVGSEGGGTSERSRRDKYPWYSVYKNIKSTNVKVRRKGDQEEEEFTFSGQIKS